MDALTGKLSRAAGDVSDHAETWHYGLIARWWAEFNTAEAQELDYYGAAIRKFGEPVLDLGCGTGRLLVPLVAEGFDVDGVDVSSDMITAAQVKLGGSNAMGRLHVQQLHELSLNRMYRTAYMCGVLGIGGRRDFDRDALHLIHKHLEPGGGLLITHWLPYGETDKEGWSDWLPGRRQAYPAPWPEQGDRKRAADGDQIELLSRVTAFDPLAQQLVLAMRARLWRDGGVVREEAYTLRSCVYFAQEILLMLAGAGFRDIAVQSGHTGEAATGDDRIVTFVGIK